MPKFFVKEEQINIDKISIIGKDVKHIKNVLRKKIGEELIVCNDLTQKDFLCTICLVKENVIECKIKEELYNNVETNIKVSIFQGLPKSDKMELIIQKSVELGVYDIIPVEMKRSIIKLDEKDKEKKTQRWQKISEVAAKQSGRNIIPRVNKIITLKNMCDLCREYDLVIVAYENEQNNYLKSELKKLEKNKNQKIAILIGPEGGIDEIEINSLKQVGAKIVTLGKRILRTETVALNILSIIMYEFEN